MSQLGARPAYLVSGWKDESRAVEASPLDAKEHEAAPVAVSHRHADSADRPAAKTHRFHNAEVVAGRAISLLGPNILNPKANVLRHIVTLPIQRSTASQQNGG